MDRVGLSSLTGRGGPGLRIWDWEWAGPGREFSAHTRL